ncbi:uncharacterized protein LOC62_05G007589 [Vanrija pseudolonga]|uniref:Uncharacterized protein n=1 Tax=Vanrija pseudolonga TaxID=143232 RepID=A0AAF0YFS6_9TREE|nr:hypothetical protein LOC62_05G007589 [Vanrija pseudolonga]
MANRPFVFPFLRGLYAASELEVDILNERLNEYLGCSFDDLRETRTNSTTMEQVLVKPDGTEERVPYHYVASIGPGPRSILWGWQLALDAGRRDPVADEIREYGRYNGIDGLCTPEVEFPPGFDHVDDDSERQYLAHELGVATTAILHQPYFTFAAGRGSFKVVVLDLPLRPITFADLGSVPRYLEENPNMMNEQAAVRGFAESQGWTVKEPVPPRLVISESEPATDDNSYTIDFTLSGRLFSFTKDLPTRPCAATM